MKNEKELMLGGAIRLLREAMHMTQAQLAEHLGRVSGTVQNYERGRVSVPLSEVVRIAALGDERGKSSLANKVRAAALASLDPSIRELASGLAVNKDYYISGNPSFGNRENYVESPHDDAVWFSLLREVLDSEWRGPIQENLIGFARGKEHKLERQALGGSIPGEGESIETGTADAEQEARETVRRLRGVRERLERIADDKDEADEQVGGSGRKTG